MGDPILQPAPYDNGEGPLDRISELNAFVPIHFENEDRDCRYGEGGDSGSAVLSEDKKIVGLLFAGSTTITVFNRIQNVFEAFEVSLP